MNKKKNTILDFQGWRSKMLKKLRQSIVWISIILIFTSFCLGVTAKEDFSNRFFIGICLIIVAGILALLFVPNN